MSETIVRRHRAHVQLGSGRESHWDQFGSYKREQDQQRAQLGSPLIASSAVTSNGNLDSPIASTLSALASEMPLTRTSIFFGVNATASTVLNPASASFSQSLAAIPCCYPARLGVSRRRDTRARPRKTMERTHDEDRDGQGLSYARGIAVSL